MKILAVLFAILATSSFAAEDALEAIKKLPPLPFKEESVGNYKTPGAPLAPGVSVKGAFVGAPFTVDAAFAAQNENAPPSAPFKVAIPDHKALFIAPGGKNSGNPELVKITTATEDKRAVEILRLTNLSVPRQATPEERVKLCAYLLQTQALPGATKGYDKVSFLEIYATKVGGYDAACLHAHMTSAKSGEHYAVKLVGILHPSQDGGVLAFLMANTNLSDIKDPADLGSKGVGLAIIHSLNFLETAKR